MSQPAELQDQYVTTIELVPRNPLEVVETAGDPPGAVDGTTTGTAEFDWTDQPEIDWADQPAIGWFRYGPITGRLKRVIDLVLSAILLVVLSPLLLAIAAAVRLTSPGPALFRQTRVGFAEQPFTMLKFRSMEIDNDESIHRELVTSMLQDHGRVEEGVGDSALFKMADDPRVTPLGRWLRKTSLDELPQLFNVLRGQMSLVGPRPSLFYEIDHYEPRHRLRAACMPGMTGLWQVDGRNSVHMLDALDLDIQYLETCSLRNDLKILARTVTVFTEDRAA